MAGQHIHGVASQIEFADVTGPGTCPLREGQAQLDVRTASFLSAIFEVVDERSNWPAAMAICR
jgi:hypothetical protein